MKRVTAAGGGGAEPEPAGSVVLSLTLILTGALLSPDESKLFTDQTCCLQY